MEEPFAKFSEIQFTEVSKILVPLQNHFDGLDQTKEYILKANGKTAKRIQFSLKLLFAQKLIGIDLVSQEPVIVAR